jgi:hypothetical protein
MSDVTRSFAWAVSYTPNFKKETSMSPEHPYPNSEHTNAQLFFLQRALASADRAKRTSRIVVYLLAILVVIAFIWINLHISRPEIPAGPPHSLLGEDLFFPVSIFAITIYLRHVMNRDFRTILRVVANTRPTVNRK